MGLDTRLRLAKLHLVTDTRGGGKAFGDFCIEVFRHGVDMLQIRERGISAAALTDALETARSVALQLNKLVVVSEDLTVATAFGADVVQLDATHAKTAKQAKATQHEYALIGVATHDEAGLAAALADDAVSYLTVGPVFGGEQTPYELPGLDYVRLAADRAPVADVNGKPWFAIGGINAGNLDDVLAAGARRVVITRRSLGSGEPGAAVEAVADRLRTAWNDDEALQDYAFSVFSGNVGHLKP